MFFISEPRCQTYPSLSSVATDMSCDSSEMFGSGRSNIFSKEFSEVLLVYQQDEQENVGLRFSSQCCYIFSGPSE